MTGPEIEARYGPAIAAEVAKRLAEALSCAGPASLRYADTLPAYFIRQALWRREMDACKGRLARDARPTGAAAAYEHRQAAAAAAGGPARGEANPAAKLTDTDVRAIRSRRATGEAIPSIAAAYGITPNAAGMIARRQRWAHVPDHD